MLMAVDMVMIVVVIMLLGDEEVRLDVEDAVEVERPPLEHVGERDVAFRRPMERSVGVDGADARLDLAQLRRRHEIGLVDDDDVGEGDLVLRLRGVAQPRGEPLGVGDRHHRVEPGRLLHVLVDEEGLRHRRRVGEAGRLDDDRVEPALPLHQPFDDADEVAAHGAADAAVVHLEHFLVGADDEFVVDADFAELVDDDRVALAVRLAEDAVQERRLAGAEIAGEDGHGNFFGLASFRHALRLLKRLGVEPVYRPEVRLWQGRLPAAPAVAPTAADIGPAPSEDRGDDDRRRATTGGGPGATAPGGGPPWATASEGM